MKIENGILQKTTITGSELSDFLSERNNVFASKFRIDRNINYVVYGIRDNVEYKEKSTFFSDCRKGLDIIRSAFFDDFQLCFSPLDKENINMQEYYDSIQVEVEEKQHEKRGRKAEIPDKIRALVNSTAQSVQQIAKAAEVSYASANKILGALVQEGFAKFVEERLHKRGKPTRKYMIV